MNNQSLTNPIIIGMLKEAKEDAEIGVIMTNAEILAHHTNKISYHEPTEKKPKAYYYTYVGNSQLTAATKTALLKKVADKLQLNLQVSFEDCYEKAIQLKLDTEGMKPVSAKRYERIYKRYIDADFSSMDIKKITPSFLKGFIQKKLLEVPTSKREFIAFKSILNFAFDYASDPEFNIIDVNPVPKNNRPFYKSLLVKVKKPEDKAFQPEDLDAIRAEAYKRIETARDYASVINAYAILTASLTGMRIGSFKRRSKGSDVL